MIVSPLPSVKSVQRPGRRCVRELIDRINNSTPDRHAGGITSGCEFVGSSGALHQSRIAVAFKHQVRDAPYVDLGYHTGKAARLRSIKV